MGLIKTLVLGRENGIRRSILRTLTGTQKPPTTPRPESTLHETGEKALNLGVEAPKDVTPPDGYEVVLHKDALEPGQVIEVIIAGRAIAVCNVDETYHALSNTCPHAEGPLGEGSLDATVLSCPYHGWEFDVLTGQCLTQPECEVPTYKVEIVGDAVCVEV